MNFQDFQNAITERLDLLKAEVAAEKIQVGEKMTSLAAEIADLRELLLSGQGTPEQYEAILSNVDTIIEAVRDIYEPETPPPADDNGDDDNDDDDNGDDDNDDD